MNTKKSKNRRTLKEDERAISPVIGVILMVAITVGMAAALASFVYGYGSSMEKPEQVSATARHHGSDITVTYMGGPDHESVAEVNAICNGDSMFNTTGNAETNNTVGNSWNSTVAGRDNHIVVTVDWSSGSTNVILDTYC